MRNPYLNIKFTALVITKKTIFTLSPLMQLENSGRSKHCTKNVNGRHNNKSKTNKTFFLELKKQEKWLK